MVFSWGRVLRYGYPSTLARGVRNAHVSVVLILHVLRGEQDTQSQRVWETLDLDVDWSEVRNAALPILNKCTLQHMPQTLIINMLPCALTGC
jgi:hypothetical protein